MKYRKDRASWHDIAAERRHQIMGGFGPECDDRHEEGELLFAAISYVTVPGGALWPWEQARYRPSDDPIDNLVVAASFISAEIDRLKRREMRGLPVVAGLVCVAMDADDIMQTVDGALAIRDELNALIKETP